MWQNVIFSDEKIFRCRPGGQIRFWRQKNESKYVAKYVVPQVQKAEGVMVWAAMNGAGKIELKRYPAKVKSGDYQAILASAKAFIRPRYSLT